MKKFFKTAEPVEIVIMLAQIGCFIGFGVISFDNKPVLKIIFLVLFLVLYIPICGSIASTKKLKKKNAGLKKKLRSIQESDLQKTYNEDYHKPTQDKESLGDFVEEMKRKWSNRKPKYEEIAEKSIDETISEKVIPDSDISKMVERPTASMYTDVAYYSDYGNENDLQAKGFVRCSLQYERGVSYHPDTSGKFYINNSQGSYCIVLPTSDVAKIYFRNEFSPLFNITGEGTQVNVDIPAKLIKKGNMEIFSIESGKVTIH